MNIWGPPFIHYKSLNNTWSCSPHRSSPSPGTDLFQKRVSPFVFLRVYSMSADKYPESSLIMVNPHIDLCFDLDLAITAVDNTSEISKSTSMVSTMPTVTPPAEACTVCKEGYQENEDGKQLPCGHVYHDGCITSWLSLSHSCPLCRRCVSSQN